MRSYSWLVVLAALSSACSANPDSGVDASRDAANDHATPGDTGTTFASIHITPLDVMRTTPLGTAVDLAFTAFATPVGGGADQQVQAQWSFSNPTVASFSGATLHASGMRGGSGTVTASVGGLTATTTFTLSVTDDVAMDALDPSLIARVTSAMDDPSLAPTWRYPEEGVVIPPNVHGVAWDLALAAGTDTFVITFSNGANAVRVIARNLPVTFDRTTWQRLVTLLGPGTVTVAAYGFAASSPDRAGHATRTVQLSSAALLGALYYWASTGGYPPVAPNEDTTMPRGYFRYDFNDVTRSEQAGLFLGFNRAGNVCVGCHSLTRDGTLLATSFGGDTQFGVLTVSSTANPVGYVNGGPTDASATGNFSAFTPDGHTLLVTINSSLCAFDVSTPGTHPLGCFTTPAPATHITLSRADGSTVLYVEDTGGGTSDTHVLHGRIVQITYDAAMHQFRNRTVLVDESGASVYYPSLSPDGSWLIYDRVTSGDSLSNPAAEIWARRLSGGTPVRLARANKGPSLSDSWPRFAPFPADDGLGQARYFITYSSTRPYRAISGRPQLWFATFDPAAADGADPSTPGLWLPVQDSATNNHAAQWTDVYVPPPG